MKTILCAIAGSAKMMEVEFAIIKTIKACIKILSQVAQLMAYVASQMHRLAIVLLIMDSKCAV